MAEGKGKLWCPICQSDTPDILEDNAQGDVICRDCGAVLDNLIDMGSEWRSFANDGTSSGGGDPSRVGGAENPLLQDGGLSTSIARDPTKSAGANQISKWNKMGAVSSTDRNLITAFKEIDRMADGMQLPQKMADRAKEIYKQVETNKSLRGRSGEAIIAATVYISCRMAGVPRSLKEIAAQTSVPKKDIGSSFNFVKKLLGYNGEMEVIKSGYYMTRFCSHLQLPDVIGRAAGHVATTATELGAVAGKSPISVAAAAIYLICAIAPPEQRPDRAVIAEVTGVSESTIRQSYKDMYPVRHKILPPTSMWTPFEDVDKLPPG